jgi:capsular polysaccharide biosynthesis protein
MEEFDIRDLIYTIRTKWWVIFITAIAATAIAAVYSIYILEPVYSADTSLYVGRNTETDTAVAYNDLLLGDRLVSDYRELVKSRRVTGMTIQELGLEDITSKQLADKVSVQSKRDTRIIEISVQDEDPKTAMDVANTIASIFKEQVVEIMEVQNVQIIDKAVENTEPIKPDVRMNIAIGLVLGIMLGTGLVFLVEYLDTNIKTPEDIKKHLDLPVIGVIPRFND